MTPTPNTSISRNVFEPEHLITLFAMALRSLDKDGKHWFDIQMANMLFRDARSNPSLLKGETALAIQTGLEVALDDFSPPGCRFRPNPEDRSEYGWWKTQEEEPK